MKTGVIIAAAVLLSACGRQSASNTCPSDGICDRGTEAACVTAGVTTDTVRDTTDHFTADRVEVLYFHTRRRCATCKAIESRTRELVEQAYARETADGRVALRIVDISQDPATAERYGVAWSSLLICSKGAEGRERVKDLTSFAFANARTAPDKFREGLIREIDLQIGK